MGQFNNTNSEDASDNVRSFIEGLSTCGYYGPVIVQNTQVLNG